MSDLTTRHHNHRPSPSPSPSPSQHQQQRLNATGQPVAEGTERPESEQTVNIAATAGSTLCVTVWLVGWLLPDTGTRPRCVHRHYIHEDEEVFRPSRQVCNDSRCGLCRTVVKVRSALQRNVLRQSSG